MKHGFIQFYKVLATVCVLGGGNITKIGEGTILGAQAVVKGIFPNNCVIAGNLAKIIRKNIAWSKKSAALSACGPYIRKTED